MFNKTSSIEFLKYGDVFSNNTYSKQENENVQHFNIEQDNFTFLFYANNDIYLKVISGIGMLVIYEDNQYHEFVIHRIVKINQGVRFNFISLSNKLRLELVYSNDTSLKNEFIENGYSYKRIYPLFKVEEIIAFYYNNKKPNYFFPGEKDIYLEITYVESGTLISEVDSVSYTLNRGDIIVYAPGQFHTQSTLNTSCSYLTIVVDVKMKSKDFINILTNKVFTTNDYIKKTIQYFVEASSSTYQYKDAVLLNACDTILLNLIKQQTYTVDQSSDIIFQQTFDNELLNEVILYINQHIYTLFSNVDELCKHFYISRSTLQNLFKKYLKVAPKRYILYVKLNTAKKLIKESKHSVSEVSSLLGFSSIHYFSRVFKQEFNITPSDYSNSIIKK